MKTKKKNQIMLGIYLLILMLPFLSEAQPYVDITPSGTTTGGGTLIYNYLANGTAFNETDPHWTGNLTMGNNYILNASGGAYIRHNGTGWVIQG